MWTAAYDNVNFFTKRYATMVIRHLTVQTLPDGLETQFTPPDTTQREPSCLVRRADGVNWAASARTSIVRADVISREQINRSHVTRDREHARTHARTRDNRRDFVIASSASAATTAAVPRHATHALRGRLLHAVTSDSPTHPVQLRSGASIPP